MFIAFLCMFLATVCPSSGENTVPMRHLVFVSLYRWLICRAEFRYALHRAEWEVNTELYLKKRHVWTGLIWLRIRIRGWLW